jgi:hypothetical protein
MPLNASLRKHTENNPKADTKNCYYDFFVEIQNEELLPKNSKPIPDPLPILS